MLLELFLKGYSNSSLFDREVKKSINKTKSLVESYQAILNAKRNGDERNVDPASVRLINDIRTNMKSINWDLQDLKETISELLY